MWPPYMNKFRTDEINFLKIFINLVKFHIQEIKINDKLDIKPSWTNVVIIYKQHY